MIKLKSTNFRYFFLRTIAIIITSDRIIIIVRFQLIYCETISTRVPWPRWLMKLSSWKSMEMKNIKSDYSLIMWKRQSKLFFITHSIIKNGADDFPYYRTDTESDDYQKQCFPYIERHHNNIGLNKMHTRYPIEKLCEIRRNNCHKERSKKMKTTDKNSHSQSKLFCIDHSML